VKIDANSELTIPRQTIIWIGVVLLLIFILWMLKGILLPFVAGFALAYLLDPLADRLSRAGLGRTLAALVILCGFIAVVILFIAALAPLLSQQFQQFMIDLPGYINRVQQVVADQLGWLRGTLGVPLPGAATTAGGLVSQAGTWLATALGGLWAGGAALISIAGLFVITPVVAFYMLVDWDRMVATVDGWLPRKNRDTIRRLAREMNTAVAGFIRGQAIVCVLLGLMYAFGLTLVGLNFGLLIGLLAGIISFIPYVGTLTGLLVGTGVAVAQFWPDFWSIGGVLAVFAAGQFLEGNILQPNLVGRQVGLHPVWLMFSLFAFGYLFGFVGVLLAVPLAAAIGVLTRFALGRYKESPLYRGAAKGK
jgi:predicted PurR-regulated permease PerM